VNGARNPWRGPGEHLGVGDLSGTEILEGLTDIIDSWPGEKTAVIKPEDRHLRFILAVAGYPEVEPSTRPFDMPLSGKSTHCLSVSRMIDSVVGMHHNTSLRSSILNNDLHLRSAGVDRFEGFEVWTEPLIEEILEKRPLSNSDEKKKWEVLSRHYFEKKGDELTLVVLPEKK